MNEKDIPVKVETANPAKVYDYQSLILNGVCKSCNKRLEWHLGSHRKEDDKFCYTECCHIRYSLIPESVRVIAGLASSFTETATEDDDALLDDDFIKQLREMT